MSITNKTMTNQSTNEAAIPYLRVGLCKRSLPMTLFLLVVLFVGLWASNVHAQEGVTYDTIRSGGLDVRVYRAGQALPAGSTNYGGDNICVTVPDHYLSELMQAVTYFGPKLLQS